MKICIIGGGLTGLAAAYRLGSRHEVDLFEKRDHLGGCLSSYRIDDYWIEHYYHHCFASDHLLLTLLKELGIGEQLEWLRGSTGYYADGTIYPLTTPLEILSYPKLTLADKARLSLLTLRSRRIDAESLDGVTARAFIIEQLGERLYTDFFEPLLMSKFGEQHEHVSAAWLIGRIAIRSNRGLSGERLGYLRGGFQELLDALDYAVGKECTVRLNDAVTSLAQAGSGWRVNSLSYDAVLSTIPPQALLPAGGPQLPAIPYQGAACMTIGLDREVTKGIYWLNMKDPAPYRAVITHTNFAPHARYGEHIVYLASYFSGNVPLRIDQAMLGDFCRRFAIDKSSIHWTRLAIDPWAGPVFSTGYRTIIPSYREKGIYWAGMFSRPNYPERSMEGSITAGFEAAMQIERELDS